MTGITKKFGDAFALDSVDFRAEYGAIQALVGENGAGKTTLMKVLYGQIEPDAGSILVEGQPVRFKSVEDAISRRVSMVSQHYAIIPELTCLQNLLMGAEPGFLLDRKAATARAQELAEKMGFHFDWEEFASQLSPAGMQKLEILKLLWRDARIMILDEPTAMLSPWDADALYESLQSLAEQGACIIVVTHRLPEVMRYCRTVTVLRRGVRMAEMPVIQTTSATLAEMIIGHAPPAVERKVAEPHDEIVLRLKDVSVKGNRGDFAVQQASLNVHSGQVVGIAGVDGSGQRELFQAILGLIPLESGSMELLGRDASPLRPADRLTAGLRIIPEDRLVEGAIPDWTLLSNSVLGLQRSDQFRRGAGLDAGRIRDFFRRAADRFRTKRSSESQRIAELSGGNQQRFVAGRAMESGPRLLLAFQPARGLDIDGSAQIFTDIRRACHEEGAAALIVGFDLDELLENCDRVVAMSRGELRPPHPNLEGDRAEIGRLMVEAT